MGAGVCGAGGATTSGPYYMPGPRLPDMAKRYVGVDEAGRLADGDLRRRITDHLMEAHAFALIGRRALEETKSNQGPSAASSVLKNVGSKVRQDSAELRLEVLGQQGLGWSGPGFSADELAVIKVMLRGKAGTIAGGSYEIQNNIISKRILGLPEATQKG